MLLPPLRRTDSRFLASERPERVRSGQGDTASRECNKTHDRKPRRKSAKGAAKRLREVFTHDCESASARRGPERRGRENTRHACARSRATRKAVGYQLSASDAMW